MVFSSPDDNVVAGHRRLPLLTPASRLGAIARHCMIIEHVTMLFRAVPVPLRCHELAPEEGEVEDNAPKTGPLRLVYLANPRHDVVHEHCTRPALCCIQAKHERRRLLRKRPKRRCTSTSPCGGRCERIGPTRRRSALTSQSNAETSFAPQSSTSQDRFDVQDRGTLLSPPWAS